MKSNQLTYLLAFSLALAVAATGCKHKPYGVTPLHGQPTTIGETPSQPPSTAPLPTPDNVTGIPMKGDWSPDDPNLVRDASTLAAQTVHFDYDSSVVKKSEQSRVEAVVAALQSDSVAKLLIEGHCDERGTEEYNRALGERRALALREALAKLGIDPNRVRTLSYGEDKPVAPGHNEAAWRQNRRGEFVLFHPKQ